MASYDLVELCLWFWIHVLDVLYYDIRKKCEGNLCYDFSNVETFLNEKTVRDDLGVGNLDFVSCSSTFSLPTCLFSVTISTVKMLIFVIWGQGTSSTVNYDKILANAVTKTNILLVEGYLFELPDTIRAITEACQKARSNGALVAITTSDEIIGNHADLIFANSDEARALCNFDAKESSALVTRYLSHFVSLVSVTNGHRGSYISLKGEAVYILPFPCVPVDTCGARDAYACGILYGVLRGISDLKSIGSIAVKVTATVVGQQGTRLRVSDAVKLAESFTFHRSTIGSDIGTDHISSV
ncbi:hypothetical protein Ahy_A07g034897 [Arachis hypogaea]|uniref:Carbohydrate kinase PfkB domain-containing protein n=1 Tax=Arachis hypogaea TaxID=3818 RepID=A0A445CDD1_ARAHY|nr:hypothetical protein Ahy_A07g034897 [Arachis hypogaea]